MADDGDVYDNDSATNDDVVDAINRVERAIEEKWSIVQSLFVLFCVVLLWSAVKDAWYSKWRLGTSYGVGTDKIIVDKTPHDCDFFAAPMGAKYCSYNRQIATIQWATSTNGEPIVSNDEGKTWSTFTPEAGASVPKYPTVQQVYVSWKKTEE